MKLVAPGCSGAGGGLLHGAAVHGALAIMNMAIAFQSETASACASDGRPRTSTRVNTRIRRFLGPGTVGLLSRLTGNSDLWAAARGEWRGLYTRVPGRSIVLFPRAISAEGHPPGNSSCRHLRSGPRPSV